MCSFRTFRWPWCWRWADCGCSKPTLGRVGHHFLTAFGPGTLSCHRACCRCCCSGMLTMAFGLVLRSRVGWIMSLPLAATAAMSMFFCDCHPHPGSALDATVATTSGQCVDRNRRSDFARHAQPAVTAACSSGGHAVLGYPEDVGRSFGPSRICTHRHTAGDMAGATNRGRPEPSRPP